MRRGRRATSSPWPGPSTRERTRSSATSPPNGCWGCRDERALRSGGTGETHPCRRCRQNGGGGMRFGLEVEEVEVRDTLRKAFATGRAADEVLDEFGAV